MQRLRSTQKAGEEPKPEWIPRFRQLFEVPCLPFRFSFDERWFSGYLPVVLPVEHPNTINRFPAQSRFQHLVDECTVTDGSCPPRPPGYPVQSYLIQPHHHRATVNRVAEPNYEQAQVGVFQQ